MVYNGLSIPAATIIVRPFMTDRIEHIETQHRRYQQQAGWTRELRYHLYRRVHLARCRDILEIGCGTGVIASEISLRTGTSVVAVDRDPAAVRYARDTMTGRPYRCAVADAVRLPFADAAFDLLVTHYFWMWQKNIRAVLAEAVRVLRPGGRLAALAEPDYGRRIDHPRPMENFNSIVMKALTAQGADPEMGHKLQNLFAWAGLRTESGEHRHGWGPDDHHRSFDDEWSAITSLGVSETDLARYRAIEKGAIAGGQRSSEMPVWWAVGRTSEWSS